LEEFTCGKLKHHQILNKTFLGKNSLALESRASKSFSRNPDIVKNRYLFKKIRCSPQKPDITDL